MMQPYKKGAVIALIGVVLAGCSNKGTSQVTDMSQINDPLQYDQPEMQEQANHQAQQSINVPQLVEINPSYLGQGTATGQTAQVIPQERINQYYGAIDQLVGQYESPRGEYYLRAKTERPLRFYGYELPRDFGLMSLNGQMLGTNDQIIAVYTNYDDAVNKNQTPYVIAFILKSGVPHVYVTYSSNLDLVMSDDLTLLQGAQQIIR